MKAGNKSDRIDVAKLGKLLRLGELRPVYQGAAGVQGLKQLVHGYEALVQDSTRVKNRMKAIYRGRAVSSKGEAVYEPEEREQWLAKLKGVERQQRTRRLYQQLDQLQQLRAETEKEVGRSARRHGAYKWISSVPGFGPIRTAQVLATVMTPQRFRGKRQFWPYLRTGSGDALEH
jgi:transposase